MLQYLYILVSVNSHSQSKSTNFKYIHVILFIYLRKNTFFSLLYFLTIDTAHCMPLNCSRDCLNLKFATS